MPYPEGEKWRAKVTYRYKRHTALLGTYDDAVRWEQKKREELGIEAGALYRKRPVPRTLNNYSVYFAFYVPDILKIGVSNNPPERIKCVLIGTHPKSVIVLPRLTREEAYHFEQLALITFDSNRCPEAGYARETFRGNLGLIEKKVRKFIDKCNDLLAVLYINSDTHSTEA